MPDRTVQVDFLLSNPSAEHSYWNKVVNVSQVTFIDNESHGAGPVGSLDTMLDGTRRLILSSPNVAAVMLTAEKAE